MSRHSFSYLMVTQGGHNFYMLSAPSEVLAETSFVTNRDDDPIKGFQRLLSERRAQAIADYIDGGMGTIPTSVVLSAQKSAKLRVNSKNKTLSFEATPKSFLILDGQHRVYGFHLAETSLRVPVIIYSDLSRRDESRLFIDINTTQKPVPKELLLDIRKLAEYQEDIESMLGELFDIFNSDAKSPLLGLLSPRSKRKGKLTRVTFNNAVKPLIDVFGDAGNSEIYSALSSYLLAFRSGLTKIGCEDEVLTKPITFRAIMSVFPDVGQRVSDKHGSKFTTRTFSDALAPVFEDVSSSLFRKPGATPEKLKKSIQKGLRAKFSL